MAPIWTQLVRDDAQSFRRALQELEKVPRNVHEAAQYTLEGDADPLDVLKIGEVRIRADGEWMKRMLRAFLDVVHSSPPDEARKAYEALDNLLAGVMVSARTWTVRQTASNRVPMAWGTVVDLRSLLAQAMLELEAVRDDAEFRAALEKRRARLLEINEGFFRGKISSEVP